MADWQVGDLAVFVIGGRRGQRGTSAYAPNSPKMRKGGVYTVEAVISHRGLLGLVIKGYRSSHPTGGWLHTAFIKVTPDAADEFDREVIAALTGAPQEVGA